MPINSNSLDNKKQPIYYSGLLSSTLMNALYKLNKFIVTQPAQAITLGLLAQTCNITGQNNRLDNNSIEKEPLLINENSDEVGVSAVGLFENTPTIPTLVNDPFNLPYRSHVRRGVADKLRGFNTYHTGDVYKAGVQNIHISNTPVKDLQIPRETYLPNEDVLQEAHHKLNQEVQYLKNTDTQIQEDLRSLNVTALQTQRDFLNANKTFVEAIKDLNNADLKFQEDLKNISTGYLEIQKFSPTINSTIVRDFQSEIENISHCNENLKEKWQQGIQDVQYLNNTAIQMKEDLQNLNVTALKNQDDFLNLTNTIFNLNTTFSEAIKDLNNADIEVQEDLQNLNVTVLKNQDDFFNLTNTIFNLNTTFSEAVKDLNNAGIEFQEDLKNLNITLLKNQDDFLNLTNTVFSLNTIFSAVIQNINNTDTQLQGDLKKINETLYSSITDINAFNSLIGKSGVEIQKISDRLNETDLKNQHGFLDQNSTILNLNKTFTEAIQAINTTDTKLQEDLKSLNEIVIQNQNNLISLDEKFSHSMKLLLNRTRSLESKPLKSGVNIINNLQDFLNLNKTFTEAIQAINTTDTKLQEDWKILNLIATQNSEEINILNNTLIKLDTLYTDSIFMLDAKCTNFGDKIENIENYTESLQETYPQLVQNVQYLNNTDMWIQEDLKNLNLTLIQNHNDFLKINSTIFSLNKTCIEAIKNLNNTDVQMQEALQKINTISIQNINNLSNINFTEIYALQDKVKSLTQTNEKLREDLSIANSNITTTAESVKYLEKKILEKSVNQCIFAYKLNYTQLARDECNFNLELFDDSKSELNKLINKITNNLYGNETNHINSTLNFINQYLPYDEYKIISYNNLIESLRYNNQLYIPEAMDIFFSIKKYIDEAELANKREDEKINSLKFKLPIALQSLFWEDYVKLESLKIKDNFSINGTDKIKISFKEKFFNIALSTDSDKLLPIEFLIRNKTAFITNLHIVLKNDTVFEILDEAEQHVLAITRENKSYSNSSGAYNEVEHIAYMEDRSNYDKEAAMWSVYPYSTSTKGRNDEPDNEIKKVDSKNVGPEYTVSIFFSNKTKQVLPNNATLDIEDKLQTEVTTRKI